MNIDGARNREKIFEHWKTGLNSVLNLNTTWIAANFLNYIKHSFLGTVVDWYDSLNREEKNELGMMETPEAMFKNLCKEIEIEFFGSKLDSEEKTREWQRKINNIEIWDMRFLENTLLNLVNTITKLGIMKLISTCFMINFLIP